MRWGQLLVGLAVLTGTAAWAQPSVLGTQVVGGSYATYDLSTVGGFRQVRLQAGSGAGSGARNWEFAQGTAGAPTYGDNWRPYSSGQTLSGYNAVILASTEPASARYNSGAGGSSGLLPAVTAGNYYTFNVTPNGPGTSNDMAVLETAFSPVGITAVSTPTGVGNRSQPLVTATLAAAPAAGEYFWLRSSADNFATSALTPMTVSGATASGRVPGYAAGSTVRYYVLSSPSSSLTSATADLLTLNLNNNNSTNYQYAVGSGTCGNYAINNLTGDATGTTGTFNSFANAFAFLNTSGVSCATVFNVANTGTAYTDVNAQLNAVTGASATNTITFRWDGVGGTRPVLNPAAGTVANTSATTRDAAFNLVGTDFVTFDGLTITDLNATGNGQLEYGIAFYRLGSGTAATDGCQNNVVRNCAITLNKANASSSANTAIGLYAANTTVGATGTALTTITLAAGQNSNNRFVNNTIQNVNTGIYLLGVADATYANYDQGNDVGGNTSGLAGVLPATGSTSSYGSGNAISNFGGVAAGAASYGIRLANQAGSAVRYNAIDNGQPAIAAVYGVSFDATTNAGVTIAGNAVTLTQSSDNVCYGIQSAATGTATFTTALTTNVVTLTLANTGATNFTAAAQTYGIVNTGATGTLNVNSNTVTLNANLGGTSSSATTSSCYGIYNGSATSTASQLNTNTVVLNVNVSNTNNFSGNTYGVYNLGNTAGQLQMNGNSVTYTANLTAAGNHSGPINGIYNAGTSTGTTNLDGNTILTSRTGAGTGTLAGTLAAVNNAGIPTATLSISGNTWGPATGTSSISTTGSIFFISNSVTHTFPVVVSGNTWQNLTNPLANSNTAYGYYNNGSPTTLATLDGNVLKGITLAAQAFVGIFINTAATQRTVITNCQVTNITVGAASLQGIYVGFGSTLSQVSGCLLRDLSGGSTVTGIATSTSLSGGLFFNNTVRLLSSTGSSQVTGLLLSLSTGGVATVYGNRLADLSGTVAGSTVYGLSITAGTTFNVYNNVVGNLTASSATGSDAVRGFSLTGGTTVNAYHNTIYLAGTATGSGYGSSGISLNGTTTTDLRNNVVVNKQTRTAGAGLIVALRRASASVTGLAIGTNSNLYYSGANPTGTVNPLYHDGTNPRATLADYKAFIGGPGFRERLSVTEDVPFASTTGTDATFLGINPAVDTQVESGGTVQTGTNPAAAVAVTTDYNGTVTRNTVTPDLGAYEGTYTGTVATDLTPPSSVYAPYADAPVSLSPRTVTATLTDRSGTATVRLYYRKSSNGNVVNDNTSGTDGWKYVTGTNTSGNTYSFSIDYSLLSGGVASGQFIQYFFVAQDAATGANVGIYAGQTASPPTTLPTSISLATANLPAGTFGTTNSTNSYALTAGTTFAGTIYVGGSETPSATTYTSLTGAAPGGLFAALNGGLLTGSVTVRIRGNTVEPGTNALNRLQTSPNTSGFTLSIVPDDATERQLVGTAATNPIRFNGVTGVTIDGSSGGSGRYLRFRNTSTSVGTIQFLNDATSGNQVSSCVLANSIIEGASTSTTTGTVQLTNSGSTSTTGLNNLTIRGNDIRDRSDAAGVPANGIYAAGVTATPIRDITVQGNVIRNFLNAGLLTSATGIGDNWTVGDAAGGTTPANGNQVYQEATRTAAFTGISITQSAAPAPAVVARGVVVRSNSVYQTAGTNTSAVNGIVVAGGGSGIVIENNYVGGATATATGSALTAGGQFFGIGITGGNAAAYPAGQFATASVQGNIVRDITNSSTTTGTFGVIVLGGSANIGTTAGNTIGGDPATSAAITSTYFINAFNVQSAATSIAIQNNTVRGLLQTGTTTGASLIGIGSSAAGYPVTVSGNTIRDILPAVGTVMTVVTGILITGAATNATVTNNTVQTLRNGSGVSSTTNVGTTGISVTATGVATITGNRVTDVGVNPATTAQSTSTNTGYYLVTGLTVSGVAGGSQVAKNRIWNVYGASVLPNAGSNDQVRGVAIGGSTSATFANNQVTMPGTSSASAQVYGMFDSSTGANNYYYNTVYLAPQAGTSVSFGFRRSSTAAVQLRNNFLFNDRTGTGVTVAISNASTTNWTSASSNNNFFVTANAAQVGDWLGTQYSLAGWQNISGGDGASFSDLNNTAQATAANVFQDPGTDATTGGNLLIKPSYYLTSSLLESKGVAVSVTDDYEGQNRPGGGGTSNGGGQAPDIGSDEYNGAVANPVVYASSTVVQVTSNTFAGGTNQAVVRLVVTNTGLSPAINLTQLTVNTGGTTSLADLGPTARVYFTGASTTFSTGTLFGSAAIPGTLGANFTISGNQAVQSGDNNFWLAYDVAAGATAGNFIDGQVTSFVLDGTSRTPTVTDPAGSRQIAGPLDGTYTVGTTLTNEPYATLKDALADASNRGIKTAANGGVGVTFLLTNPGSTKPYNVANGETLPLAIGNIAGASATTRLTIRPYTGTQALISGSSTVGIVALTTGASYVTIDGSNTVGGTTQNLTIENTTANTSSSYVLAINPTGATSSVTTGNAVRNTVLRGNTTSAPAYGLYVANSGSNTLQNNLLYKAGIGMQLQGSSTSALDAGNTVTGNQLGQSTAGNGFLNQGLVATYQTGLTVTGNDIQNVGGVALVNVYAINLTDNKNAVVSRNVVHGISYSGASTIKVWAINSSTGTFTTAANASNNRFDNNWVYGISSTAVSTVWNTVGINCNGGYGDQYYYNSVALSGQLSAAGGTAGSAAFANGNPSVTATVTNIDVRNNIFSISGGTGGTASTPLYAHYEQGSTVAGSTLNNNDLFVSVGATGLAVIGRLNGTDYATLPAWQTATGMEGNSVSVLPPFVSATNLHINNTQAAAVQLDGKATPVSVTTDYDGETRSATTPDIGADEFALPSQDVGISALTAPAATVCYTGAQPITVTLSNYGATATVQAIPVSVVVTFPNNATTTVTGTYTGAAIPAGGSVSFTVGTYTVNGTGTYLFDARTTYNSDSNTGNDALAQQTVQVTVPEAITLTASPTGTICANSPVTLTASSNTPYDYVWTSTTGGGLPTPATGASITATPTQTATYTVTGTTPGGCLITQTITITVNPAPTVTVSPTTSTVCAGTPQTLTASGTITGTQTILPTATFDSGADGFTVTTNNSGVSGAANNTSGAEFSRRTAPYTESGADLSSYNGPSGANPGQFFLANSATNTTTSNTQLVSPAFSTVNYAAATLSFQQFYRAYSTGDVAVAVEYSLNGSTWTQLTSYRGNTQGTATGAQTPTTIALPAAALGQASVQVRFNYVSTFGYAWALDNVGVTGTLVPTYQWTLVSGDGLPATTNTASISVTPTQTSVYRVTATNPQTNCTASATSTVNVNPRPTATLSASPAAVNPGGTSTVSIAFTGTAPWTFTYTTNGANPVTVPNNTTNPYTFTTPALSSSITYAVTALRDASCVATSADLTGSSVTVNVIAPVVDVAVVSLVSPASTAPGTCANPAQTVTVRIQNAGAQLLDFGQNPVTVTATVSGPNPQPFSTTLSTGTLAVNDTRDVVLTTTYDMSGAGTYTFNLQASTSPQDGNPGNDTRTETRVVTVPAAVTVTPASSTVCVGSSQTLTASVPTATLLPTATFESSNDGFTVTTNNSGVSGETSNTSGAEFTRVAGPYTAISSTYYGPAGVNPGSFFVAYNDGSTITSNTQLVSPAFSTVGYPGATLSFQQYYRAFSSGDVAVKVEYSLDGTTWTQLATYLGTTNGTSSGAQAPTTIALPAAALGQPNVRVRFNYLATNGYYWALDNVGVSYTQPTTYAWTRLSGDATPATGSTAAFTVTAGSLSSVYQVTATNPATGCSTTATATVNVTTETVWTGAVSNAWLASGNWTACVPSATISARIPAGLTTYPTVSAASVTKNLVVESGASVSHTGAVLQVWGDLTNNGTYTATGGTIAFRAAVPQLVSGITSYNNLTVNQATTASTVTMMNSATVSGNLTLTAGVLNTNGNTLTLGNTAAIVSETDANYVLGRVATTRTLAAGTAQSFGTLGLTLTPDAGSTAPGLTAVVRVTGTTLSGQGTSQSIQRYFDIQPAVNTGLSVTMAFSYLDHERNSIPAASMQLFKSTTGTSGPWERQLNTAVSGNTVTKTGITDFSVWTLGSGDNPLPVQLVKFEAVRQGTDALLSWTTASELNNRGFEVQVSPDGSSYRTLGFVAGAGNSSNLRTYGFVDREAGKVGVRYYRLNQLDLSGQSTYSPVRTLAFEVTGLLVQAAPNPFTNTLTLSLTLPGASATPAELLLTDALGRTVLHQSLPALPAGTTQAEVAGVGQLPGGVYLLRVTLDGVSRTLKVVRE